MFIKYLDTFCYDISKKLFNLLLGHLILLVFDVPHRVHNVQEVLKIIFNRFSVKLGQNDVQQNKKYFHKLLDGFHLVLRVDAVKVSVQHIPEVLKIIIKRFPVNLG